MRALALRAGSHVDGGRGKKLASQPELRAALRLARSLGCTLAELGERMTSAEFALHVELEQREPLPPALLDLAAALMAAIHNGPLQRRDKRHWRAEDFRVGDAWSALLPPPPVQASAPGAPPAKRARLAPDLSHMRGKRVANARRRREQPDT